MSTTPDPRRHAILRFLCLVEGDDRISWTNAAMVVAVFKFAILQTFTLPELSAFFLALAAYAYKAHRRSRQVTAEHEARLTGASELLDKVKDRVQKLENRGAAGR